MLKLKAARHSLSLHHSLPAQPILGIHIKPNDTIGFEHSLPAGIARHLDHGLVGIQEPPARRGSVKAHRHTVEQGAVPLFAGPEFGRALLDPFLQLLLVPLQCQFGFLALGDVLQAAFVIQHPALLILNGSGSVVHPYDRVIVPAEAGLKVAHHTLPLHERLPAHPFFPIYVKIGRRRG